MRKIFLTLLLVVMTIASLSACSIFDSGEDGQTSSDSFSAARQSAGSTESAAAEGETGNDKTAESVSLTEIPDWNGQASIEINNNEPEFKDTEIKNEDYEKLSAMHSSGAMT